jgi:hypothetical protein
MPCRDLEERICSGGPLGSVLWRGRVWDFDSCPAIEIQHLSSSLESECKEQEQCGLFPFVAAYSLS